MNMKSFLCILLIQFTLFVTILFSPDAASITAKDYHISCMDKLLPRIFQLNLPAEKAIKNFSISFTNAKSAGRTAIIEIWFDSELPFIDVEQTIFASDADKKFQKKARKLHSAVYTDCYAEYEILYVNNESYRIHISVEKN